MSNQNIVKCVRCHQPSHPGKCGGGGGGSEGEDDNENDKKNKINKDESKETNKSLGTNGTNLKAAHIHSLFQQQLGLSNASSNGAVTDKPQAGSGDSAPVPQGVASSSPGSPG